ncbi:hypothetical protein JSY36_18495 [Bacillus sp. H-16]|uniref:hypothetical protein n=1 Tax=Alteribacter salitolerans TaxID=2912333 RepID=UPI0019623069|nr:hypothetical protein [Alteribacter salitolerans]MBM7097729.1 hypothetical protein [Alteribacter salitolerans]
MKNLPPSYLGKKVFIDGPDAKFYVVRYEEHVGKKKTHCLLFDQDTPVIFAVLSDEGAFLDSFYLSKKSNQASTNAVETYEEIVQRKKQYRVTQDDLRDALKPESEAKMKNENIMKHLVDEHLEDIKNQWPSRLLTLQKTDGKSEESLINEALSEAIRQANANKSFDFLVSHRYDHFVPQLGFVMEKYPNLLPQVTDYYLEYNETKIVKQLLINTCESVSLDDTPLIESVLTLARKIDHIHYSSVLKLVLSILFKRVKQDRKSSPKAWLNDTVHDKAIRHSIVAALKSKKTG